VIGGSARARTCWPGAGAAYSAERRLHQDRRQRPSSNCEYVLGSRTSYVGQEVYLFPCRARHLLFGLKIRPVAPATYDDATRPLREAFWKEANSRPGNPPLDPNADWVDYELAGATGPADLLPRMVDCAEAGRARRGHLRLGPARHDRYRGTPRSCREILKARHAMHGRLQDASYAGLVETFNADRYNRNLSVPRTCCSARRWARTSTATTSPPTPTCSRS